MGDRHTRIPGRTRKRSDVSLVDLSTDKNIRVAPVVV
jgi:hypothetical protein